MSEKRKELLCSIPIYNKSELIHILNALNLDDDIIFRYSSDENKKIILGEDYYNNVSYPLFCRVSDIADPMDVGVESNIIENIKFESVIDKSEIIIDLYNNKVKIFNDSFLTSEIKKLCKYSFILKTYDKIDFSKRLIHFMEIKNDSDSGGLAFWPYDDYIEVSGYNNHGNKYMKNICYIKFYELIDSIMEKININE